MLNCGIKKPEVELYRAFKLNQQTDQSLPRRIIANFSTSGAFKRSFNRFFSQRYQSDDPPCILFVPDGRVAELVKENEKLSEATIAGSPFSLLLSGIPRDETLEKINRNYIGQSFTTKLTCSMIYKAAHSRSPVLILGESGTGKELIARLIFEHSDNYKKSLVVVNCSAIPETLLESELFGHKKGSFTDASHDKEGLFSAADGGTLFLDEIGDLSLTNQAKLLRAIEEKEIRPLGGTKTIMVDVRIIAATNRNLASMMRQKTFREDLYYRLNVLTIFAPPLREHPEDIPEIASALWAKLGKSIRLSKEFLNYLKDYSWPGNVRELKTLLNSLTDYFGDKAPQPEHVLAIRSYHQKMLSESKTNGEEDFDKMLKAQSQLRIIEVQNILRGIKIMMRPIINLQSPMKQDKKIDKLKDYLDQEINKLEDLCREPIFFKNRNLFNHIKRFRYLLEKTMNRWPVSAEELHNLWLTDLAPLYETIDQEIFSIIWKKMDL
ncbi:MAG: sigma 54-interacting transcriptional regulator [Bacteroidales bacterium]|nr:sigma 54-interacting transcriptional regulator [Bacteroidales bacterium]